MPEADGALFGGVARGQARGQRRVPLDQALPLAQAAEAHRRLDSRQRMGKLVLLP